MFLFAVESIAGKSHTAFYICGGLLAAWAVVVSFIGIRQHENWPPNATVQRGVMAISVVLVIAAMATAVATA